VKRAVRFDTLADLTALIDHTLLRPEADFKAVETLCAEARRYGFHSVCVHPWWVSAAKTAVADSGIAVCSVVGFPLGMTTAKAEEARRAVADGADELDMVMAIGALKSGFDRAVERDIATVVAAGRPVKVILETGLLSAPEIRRACRLCRLAGAAFVKTSTGFGGGATPEIVRLLTSETDGRLGVKASGGIKTFYDAVRMIEAGASRIGTSRGAAIVEEFLNEHQKRRV
jgi:deoxyribose-phosphate aldolase